MPDHCNGSAFLVYDVNNVLPIKLRVIATECGAVAIQRGAVKNQVLMSAAFTLQINIGYHF